MKKTIAVWFSDPPGLGLDDQADAAAAAIENLSDCLRGQLGIEGPALEMALFDVWAAKCPREIRLKRLTNLQERCVPASQRSVRPSPGSAGKRRLATTESLLPGKFDGTSG